MKTLEIIGCLLAIIMVAHAYDENRAEQFFKNLNKCSEALNETLTHSSSKLFLCALEKDGRIIYHESIVPDEMHKFIMDVIPNKRIAQGSRNLYDICSLNAEALDYMSRARLTYIITCSQSIVPNAFTLQLD